ncbi:MAG TPA: hypothetical protein VHT34_02625 [Clostridia bacterium]|nr:hypothetical protein [Clostridia bacterium]
MSIKIAICDDAAEDAAQLSAALLAYDSFEINTNFISILAPKFIKNTV